MSDETDIPDDQKVISEVIEKLMLSGWVEASARRGNDTAFMVRPDARFCIRKLRDFVAAFGEAGIQPSHQFMFFKMLSDDTFSDEDDGSANG